MTTWGEIEDDACTLAAEVRGRFEAHGLGLLATLRADGSPRISGVEPLFADGELWLGMMPEGRKSTDLRRDPRCALHAATVDREVADGDAKVAGRAVDVTDPDVLARFSQAFEAATGTMPPGPFDLFRLDVDELVLVRPEGDHLLIRTWHHGRGERRIERG